MIRLAEIKMDSQVDLYIRKGSEYLEVIGFTEHSYRHANLVSGVSKHILEVLGFDKREAELAGIAGYLHDIGNVVSRYDHGQSGAILAYSILKRLEMPDDEIVSIIAAIGNHEEQYGQAVNNVAAAIILADKADVHRSRVRNQDVSTFDIHDRVNFAVEQSFLRVDSDKKMIIMDLIIDNNTSSVMEYFEIFLSRMLMCRRAANFLGCHFGIIINGAKLL